MKTSDLWVLVWSQRQNCFHVQPIEKTMSFNRNLYVYNVATTNDYRVLFVGSQDECSDAAEACRSTISQRDKARA